MFRNTPASVLIFLTLSACEVPDLGADPPEADPTTPEETTSTSTPTVPDPGDPCASLHRDATVAAAFLYAHAASADGTVAEWDDAAILDPASVDDACDPPTSAGKDLRGFSMTQSRDKVGFLLQLDGPPEPGVGYVIDLVPASDAAQLPDLRVMVTGDGAWGGEVTWLDDDMPIGSWPVEAAVAGDALEITVDIDFDLIGWRAQAIVESPEGVDHSRWAPLARVAGIADPTNQVYTPGQINVAMTEGASEAELFDVLSITGGSVTAFDDVLSMGLVESGHDDLAAARLLAEAIAAESTVESASVVMPAADTAHLVHGALDALDGSDTPRANWAHLQIETRHAQQVLWDCSYRLPQFGEEETLEIGVMDQNLFETTVFPHAEVTDYTTPGVTSHVGTESHGLAVASVIGEAGATGPDAFVFQDAVKGWYDADRHAGLLEFAGIDGWEIPYHLQFHNTRTDGAALGSGGLAAVVRSIGATAVMPVVVNSSVGYQKSLDYDCSDDSCAIDTTDVRPRCLCEGETFEQPMSRCRGHNRGLPEASYTTTVLAMNRALKVVDEADTDVLWIEAAGNTCTDHSTRHNTTSEFNAAFGRVMAIGAVDRDLERTWFSDFGVAIDLWAPGYQVLAWTPEVDRVNDGVIFVNETSHVSINGTSIASPLVAGVAGLVRWIRPDITAIETRDLLRETGVDGTDLSAPVLNASRAVTRALLDEIGESGDDVILSLRSTAFAGSCSVGPSETPLASGVVVGCASYDDESGAGTSQVVPSDPESTHTLTVTGTPAAGNLVFAVTGTDFSPGPGPSTTTFTVTSASQDHPSIVTNGSVWRVEGTYAGSVQLRDPFAVVTDDCLWAGDFVGELYTTSE